MNFPLFPSLALPGYFFIGLSIFIMLFGFIISLLPYAGVKKTTTAICFSVPTIIIAVISPSKEIFFISLAGYLAGLGLGSLVFYITIVWQHNQKNAVQYFNSADPYIVTGPLAKNGYMVAIRYQMATREPFQEELPSNRTCIYFGNGNLVSINNNDPSDIVYERTGGFGFFIQDINRKVTYNPSSFGSWDK